MTSPLNFALEVVSLGHVESDAVKACLVLPILWPRRVAAYSHKTDRVYRGVRRVCSSPEGSLQTPSVCGYQCRCVFSRHRHLDHFCRSVFCDSTVSLGIALYTAVGGQRLQHNVVMQFAGFDTQASDVHDVFQRAWRLQGLQGRSLIGEDDPRLSSLVYDVNESCPQCN